MLPDLPSSDPTVVPSGGSAASFAGSSSSALPPPPPPLSPKKNGCDCPKEEDRSIRENQVLSDGLFDTTSSIDSSSPTKGQDNHEKLTVIEGSFAGVKCDTTATVHQGIHTPEHMSPLSPNSVNLTEDNDGVNELTFSPPVAMNSPTYNIQGSFKKVSPVSVAVTSERASQSELKELVVPSKAPSFGCVPQDTAANIDLLSERQLESLTRIFSGQSLFITGRGGTGKSAIMKLVGDLNSLGPFFRINGLGLLKSKKILAGAPTGIAAASIPIAGSSTIYALLGIQPNCKSVRDMLYRLKKNPDYLKNWTSVELLIIDEISMISSELFDLIIDTLREVRDGDLPQVVVLGDWLQIAPIQKNRTAFNIGRDYAFKSRNWGLLFPFENVVQLHVSYRNHGVLDLMCQEMRIGKLDPATKRIMQLHTPSSEYCSSDFTHVTTRKADAACVNSKFMRKLGCEIISFPAVDKQMGICPPQIFDSFLKQCLAEKNLKLCVGAKVCLIKNLCFEVGLVNGAQGRLVEFSGDDSILGVGKLPVVDFEGGGVDTSVEHDPNPQFEVVGGSSTKVIIKPAEFNLTRLNGGYEETLCQRNQVPLLCSFAFTAHKAQSLSIPVLSANFRVSVTRQIEPTRCDTLQIDLQHTNTCICISVAFTNGS